MGHFFILGLHLCRKKFCCPTVRDTVPTKLYRGFIRTRLIEMRVKPRRSGRGRIVRGMLKNHHLARAIADMSFFEFRRQLEYKAERRGGIVIAADRWFASSKICSVCAVKQDNMPLAVRQWTCPDCGAMHDRE